MAGEAGGPRLRVLTPLPRAFDAKPLTAKTVAYKERRAAAKTLAEARVNLQSPWHLRQMAFLRQLPFQDGSLLGDVGDRALRECRKLQIPLLVEWDQDGEGLSFGVLGVQSPHGELLSARGDPLSRSEINWLAQVFVRAGEIVGCPVGAGGAGGVSIYPLAPGALVRRTAEPGGLTPDQLRECDQAIARAVAFREANPHLVRER